MTASRRIVLSLLMAMMILFCGLPLGAQATSQSKQVPSIAVSIALEHRSVSAGQDPGATLTIKNISHQNAGISRASDLWRVHIEGEQGAPVETEWQRHRHGDFRPGDHPDLRDGPVVSFELAAGESTNFVYDLTKFYELTVPGKYMVYIEFYDPAGPRDGSGMWVRTNSAQFEIQARPS